MVKAKIADLIAYLGIILGVFIGITVIRAELYLSPMSYIESYMDLVYYFYFSLSMVAAPLLIARILIRTTHKKSASIFLLLTGIVSALLFWYDSDFGQEIFLIMASLAFPILLADLLFKIGRLSSPVKIKTEDKPLIYIPLLEEGTPTMRGTEYISLGQDLYKILATSNYDPLDEVWEFLPDSVVKGRKTKGYKGNDILIATDLVSPPENLPTIMENSAEVYVPSQKGDNPKLIPTQSEHISNDIYRLLPIASFDPKLDNWPFLPSSAVRCIKTTSDKGENILVAKELAHEY